MKLLIFSDIHGNLRALNRLMDTEADYYIAAGDLATFGRGLERCGDALARRAGKVYVLPGNHESVAQVSAFCAEHGLHDFHEQHVEWAGYHIAGLGYSNHTPFNTPGEYTEAELAERLARFSGLSPLILICHCPPHDTALDRVREGVHPGSTAVRDFLEREQPEFFFCGHIHEAEGVSIRMGKTFAMNVGSAGYLLELK